MIINNKKNIEEWIHEPTIKRLMSENRWSKKLATQWFHDLMKWLYTANRWNTTHNSTFMMDHMHYLDDVWHAYILHTRDYANMSSKLFGLSFFHHEPSDPFISQPIGEVLCEKQLIYLLEDWGDEYIDRIYEYASDLYDIKHHNTNE